MCAVDVGPNVLYGDCSSVDVSVGDVLMFVSAVVSLCVGVLAVGLVCTV